MRTTNHWKLGEHQVMYHCRFILFLYFPYTSSTDGCQRQDPGHGRPLICFDLILTFLLLFDPYILTVCIRDLPLCYCWDSSLVAASAFQGCLPSVFTLKNFLCLLTRGWSLNSAQEGDPSLPTSALLLFDVAHMCQWRRFGRQIVWGRGIHFSIP